MIQHGYLLVKVFIVSFTSYLKRRVVYFKLLNQYLQSQPFKTECYFCMKIVINLASSRSPGCLFHFPFHNNHRNYLWFCIQSKAWQFKTASVILMVTYINEYRNSNSMIIAPKNIARSKQSSHKPGGSYQRL